MLEKDLSRRVKSQKSITWCSKGAGRESVKAKTTEVPSKPGKDPVKSFIRQRGYLELG